VDDRTLDTIVEVHRRDRREFRITCLGLVLLAAGVIAWSVWIDPPEPYSPASTPKPLPAKQRTPERMEEAIWYYGRLELWNAEAWPRPFTPEAEIERFRSIYESPVEEWP